MQPAEVSWMTDLELVEYNAWSDIIDRWMMELEDENDKTEFLNYLIEKLTNLYMLRTLFAGIEINGI